MLRPYQLEAIEKLKELNYSFYTLPEKAKKILSDFGVDKLTHKILDKKRIKRNSFRSKANKHKRGNLFYAFC